MFGLGTQELMIILVIIIVLFGATRLPQIGSGIGQAIRNFKKSVREGEEIDVTPDKESPLWDTFSGSIYYWTASTAGPDHAYAIVYHGGVDARRRDQRLGSLGFRAVREPESFPDAWHHPLDDLAE